jgi:hypothetical protein
MIFCRHRILHSVIYVHIRPGLRSPLSFINDSLESECGGRVGSSRSRLRRCSPLVLVYSSPPAVRRSPTDSQISGVHQPSLLDFQILQNCMPSTLPHCMTSAAFFGPVYPKIVHILKWILLRSWIRHSPNDKDVTLLRSVEMKMS